VDAFHSSTIFNKQLKADFGKAAPFSLTQKSRHFTKTA